MEQMRLGKTGLMVSRSGFGAIPIQRISFTESRELLLKAYESGINFYDTARFYTDSEEKLGNAFADVRDNVIIATKSMQTTKEGILEELETSLNNLQTDYVDLLQLHNPSEMPDARDPQSSYAGLLEAREKGMARFIGFTSHKTGLAREAVLSNLFDTLQFPLSLLSSHSELELVQLCREYDVGFIAMKALAGGLINNAKAGFAFLRQYDNVLPIWGIEKKEELDEFIALEKEPPLLDTGMNKAIEEYRKELSGSFCRGCGYCMPCPVRIPIDTAARMTHLLKRSSHRTFLTEKWKERMERIYDCQECGECSSNCPYGLDTPELLRKSLHDFLAAYRNYHRE